MKRTLLIGLASLGLLASNIQMPPSMPTLPIKKHSIKKDSKTVDKCKIIPPMLVHLPPMLEDDLDECKNSLYLPTKKDAQKKLSVLLKKEIKVKNVTALKGFSMLYKIETNRGDFYCNRKVDRCLTSSMRVIQKGTK